MNIGNNIKKIREFKGISQKKLSELSNIPNISLGRYERNERNPNIEIINKISDALNIDSDLLINGLNIEIYTRYDVFELFKKLYTDISLNDFLELDANDNRYKFLIEGYCLEADLYYKVANKLKLSDQQLYAWAMHDCISKLINYRKISVGSVEFTKKDMKIILNSDLLKPQPTEELISEGLSGENKDIINKYLNEKSSLPLKEKINAEIDNKFIPGTIKDVILKASEKVIDENLSGYKSDTFTVHQQFQHITDVASIVLMQEVFKLLGFSTNMCDGGYYDIVDTSSNKILAKLNHFQYHDLARNFQFNIDAFMLKMFTDYKFVSTESNNND